MKGVHIPRQQGRVPVETADVRAWGPDLLRAAIDLAKQGDAFAVYWLIRTLAPKAMLDYSRFYHAPREGMLVHR